MVRATSTRPSEPGPSRAVLAIVGFVGHTPGLKLFVRCRFTPRLVRVNVIAVVLTLAAMAGAFALADPGERAWSVALAWLVGHFIWSGILALWILLGGAIASAAPR
jgi:hypothetical protein